MKAYHIGFFIKQKREKEGISQKELCKGICDNSTLSRIERGKHEPSISILKALLQRLGMDEDPFSILLGPKDFEISNLQKEIVFLNTQKQFEQAAEKIKQLEKIADSEDKIVKQFILRSKALACCWTDYTTAREILLESLRITHPDFDFDHIGDYLLSIDEVKILNQIAVTYSETGDRRYAIYIYQQLFKSPLQQVVNNEARASVLSLLAYNYSRLLGKERRYEECIEVAQYGYDICVKYNKCQEMGGLLLNISYSLHALGQDEESKSRLIDSYYANRLMKKCKSCDVVRKYAEETFGMKL
ncbi:helix-turn-helix domain-containing protein [uncultured Negativibacillus sp.]|uniref:helix-turn-helix domain-containing protein n=1 Tax=uncultured Negativibacillus sp. TaxID=1980696 RepID=UPI0025D8CF2D|nr:helix-turn-helix domain-containing protein [uncultured Negativibacillus sp.]